MAYPAFKYTTLQHYLAMEQDAVEKHEYFEGEIYAMAGATGTHVLITDNLGGEIHSLLKGKKCREFTSDYRVSTEAFETYMYPDIFIVCGKTELKANCFDTVINPSVIIEVLSPSTEERDRVLKFFFYRQIPTFNEYILVETAHCKITTYTKNEDSTWTETVTEGINATLYIGTISAAIPMSDIYMLTEFAADGPDE
ncbi:MAG: Uma2 family endonuclease [Taibaiella sp.]|nr:Uma2 family endonuclease [Taibaiella sp.]